MELFNARSILGKKYSMQNEYRKLGKDQKSWKPTEYL